MKHEYLCSLEKLEDLASLVEGSCQHVFTREIYFSICCILHYFLSYDNWVSFFNVMNTLSLSPLEFKSATSCHLWPQGHGVQEKEQFPLKTDIIETVALKDSQILVRTSEKRVPPEEVEV